MATTAADTAVSHDSGLSALNRAFLLTQAWTVGHTSTDTIVEAPLLVLGYGDPSLTDISEALVTTVKNPESTALYRAAQNQARSVIDLIALDCGDVTGRSKAFMHTWRLPKGGIPFSRGDGPVLYVFNHLGNFSNGPNISSVTRWKGVWLS